MKTPFHICLVLLLFVGIFPLGAEGFETAYPPLVGKLRLRTTTPETTLMEVAVEEGLGYQNLRQANPLVDPWRPVSGQPLVLPSQAIFPGTPTPGLTINLAELRVFVAGPGENPAVTFYPLGIGRQGWETPEGDFRVVQKVEKPVWRVPPGIKAENPDLPDFVPAGPRNPLGDYWIGLSVPGYGLHGTNRTYGVGRRVSHGCIRLYDEDISRLFRTVEPGTRVRIIYQPVKATIADGDLYLEVHADFAGRYPNLFQEALHRISLLLWSGQLDYGRIRTVVAEQRGIPVKISSARTQTGT